MSRDAKDALLKRNVEILIGAEKIMSPSPRLMAQYGRYLPNEVAAALIVSFERKTHGTNRDMWATERRARRRTIRR